MAEHAPPPQVRLVPLHADVEEQPSEHGALAGHFTVALMHELVPPHSTLHGDFGSHTIVDEMHALPPVHFTLQLMPAGHVSVLLMQLEPIEQSMVHTSPEQPPVQAVGHVAGVLVIPGGQHPPPWQVSPVPQTLPHPPQLLESVFVSTQPVLQHESPVAHILEATTHRHALVLHASPGAHALPHALQFAASDVVSLHLLAQHVLATSHAIPQAPQLALSLLVSTHLPLQHALPAVHAVPHPPQLAASFLVSTHLPAQHASVAPHAFPHAPQLS